jgi:hypothetical protein
MYNPIHVSRRTTMKRMLSLAMLGLLLVAAPALAAIPRLINFQGRLADSSGTPKNGSFAMTFSLYTTTSGGSPCHYEPISVPVNSGLFNVNIGSTQGGINAGCDFSVPYYIELQVGSDSPMSPRIALTAAAYAMRAAVADNSVAVGGRVPGTGSGNIPVNGLGLNQGLNADMVDGQHGPFAPQGSCAWPYACSGHSHANQPVYSCTCWGGYPDQLKLSNALGQLCGFTYSWNGVDGILVQNPQYTSYCTLIGYLN